VTSGRRVENDEVKVVLVKTLEDLTERSGLVNSRDGAHDLGEEAFALLLHVLGESLHSLTALSSTEEAADASLT